jgi:hypothetical protein
VYVNDIWRNIDKSMTLFADICVIDRKITNKTKIKKSAEGNEQLGEWAVEKWIKMNPSKSRAIRFTRAGVKNPLDYCLGDQKISEPNSCK